MHGLVRTESRAIRALLMPGGLCRRNLCRKALYTQATRLCAAAATLREQAQTPLPPVERDAVEQVVATARAALGEFTFVTEWKTGTMLSHNEAIDDALSDASM